MKKENRLRKGSDFRKVFRYGTSSAVHSFVVVAHRRNDSEIQTPRVGISVKRKIGNAVVRNRVKRLIREAVRKQLDDLMPNLDAVIIVRSSAPQLSYSEVCDQLSLLFRRGRCRKRSGTGSSVSSSTLSRYTIRSRRMVSKRSRP